MGHMHTFYPLEAKCVVQKVTKCEFGDPSSGLSLAINYLWDLKEVR